MDETSSTAAPANRSPLVVRAAEWVGRTLGQWRRDRAERRDAAYIAMWKTAWSHGCEARWSGSAREAVPHRNGPKHDAWLAGWNWADTQPDRRVASRSPSQAHARRRFTDPDASRSA